MSPGGWKWPWLKSTVLDRKINVHKSFYVKRGIIFTLRPDKWGQLRSAGLKHIVGSHWEFNKYYYYITFQQTTLVWGNRRGCKIVFLRSRKETYRKLDKARWTMEMLGDCGNYCRREWNTARMILESTIQHGIALRLGYDHCCNSLGLR